MAPLHSVTRQGISPAMIGQRLIGKDERDIRVDIFEDGNKMRVIAELPGVDEEDIRLDLSGDILVIYAARENRSYYKDVRLPNASQNIIGKLYNTGILEVTLSHINYDSLQPTTDNEQLTQSNAEILEI